MLPGTCCGSWHVPLCAFGGCSPTLFCIASAHHARPSTLTLATSQETNCDEYSQYLDRWPNLQELKLCDIHPIAIDAWHLRRTARRLRQLTVNYTFKLHHTDEAEHTTIAEMEVGCSPRVMSSGFWAGQPCMLRMCACPTGVGNSAVAFFAQCCSSSFALTTYHASRMCCSCLLQELQQELQQELPGCKVLSNFHYENEHI